MGGALDPSSWSPDEIGDQTGRVALITGANSGIGFETARVLADHGAHVVMACRNLDKARRAADELENDLTQSSIELLALDLSDLVAVRRAAEQFVSQHARLDLLINNAGVMWTPYRQTADGFELQMATNHLGHFAFTGLVLDRLLISDRSRVVTVSSVMHRVGHLDFDDVAGLKLGTTWSHYAASKLANLLFTQELSRRLQQGGEPTIAVAAHPGWTRSNLVGAGAALSGGALRATVRRTFGHRFGQATAKGAWPTLYAATSPEVEPGQFIGPRHAGQLFGPPTVVRPSRRARNGGDAARLWDISEVLTEVHYAIPVTA
jgi:NAD(P)-dependent dehydrogenase (short-subunit alcohol dehydrogenase family)